MYRLIILGIALTALVISSCGEKKNTDTSSAETELAEGNITLTKKQLNNNAH